MQIKYNAELNEKAFDDETNEKICTIKEIVLYNSGKPDRWKIVINTLLNSSDKDLWQIELDNAYNEPKKPQKKPKKSGGKK